MLIGLVRILLVAEIEQVSANRSPVDREPWPSNQTGGNAAPSDWECHWRKAALQFGNRLQPWMTAEQQAEVDFRNSGDDYYWGWPEDCYDADGTVDNDDDKDYGEVREQLVKVL